jgi:hypothetical protein
MIGGLLRTFRNIFRTLSKQGVAVEVRNGDLNPGSVKYDSVNFSEHQQLLLSVLYSTSILFSWTYPELVYKHSVPSRISFVFFDW